ncbi:centrosome and spindle pole-associated protein 1-like [Watersipora subatra]|uniref:centrosome and spindle pole-associated protein 1-like n=1 Tax=Watersipora subatra TaxID=2589382 RepID=UPI00355C37D4
MKQRNAEYNEFLQSQQEKLNNRFADKKGHPVQGTPLPEPSRSYQDRVAQRQPNNVQSTTPRQTGAQPSYEQLLDEKRRQEQSYRRSNGPEAVNSYPTTHRQPDERRFDDLDRQFEQRRVKFATQRSNEDNADVYDWEHSKQGRSRSFYQDPDPRSTLDPYERSRSVPPKQEVMTGLAIGHSETASAAKRRKDQYRHDLDQQISSVRGNYQPLLCYSRNLLTITFLLSFSDQNGSLLDDRRPLASILNERRDLVDTSPRGNAVRLGLGAGLLERGFTGLYEPSVLSQPVSQPQTQTQGQSGGYQPTQNYQTPADAAYNYYGTHDPLAGFTAPSPGREQPFPVQTQHLTPRSLPKASAVGAFPSEQNDRGQLKKDTQLTYQQELKRQKQRIDRAKKAEQEAYDKKLNEEIANYNPFGRGGAGAPMKDSTGNVIADLRSMKQANTGQTPRPNVQAAPVPAPVQAAPQFDPTLPNLNSSYGADGLDSVGYARGGHGIFGEPKTEVQKTATDRYKEDLQKQIDEKKRVAELEKQKLKEEEEREMKRLEEDRVKIQKEYEAEQAKAKAKEEETRRKNEQMKQAAEEKRRLAEQQREEAEKKRLAKDEEARQLALKEKEEERRLAEDKNREVNRAESPPIPTLRSKTQPPGSMELRENSPLLPAQRAKTQHDKALRDSKPVIKDADPPANRASDTQPAKRDRPESRAKSAEVLNQLAHMRRQLQQERQRVENALNKQKADVEIYDPRERITRQDSADIFETARSRKPVTARRTGSKLDNNDDDQQDLPKPPQTATSLLHSDSAFIDDTGMRAAFPDDFDTLATNQNARRRRRDRMKNNPEKDTESIHSVDPDRITRKNQDRLRKLKAIAGDEISLDDPDDIIDRFMTKQNHKRPPSGQTLTDDSWINR